jgi:amino-acid N-acetyltransferase
MPRIPRINPAANSATTRAFVQWIRSAAPYIHAFRGKTFVIAFGGEVDADETFLGIVHDLNLLQSLGIRLVVVHGSRPQIEAILKQQNIPSKYNRGLRVTDAETLDCVLEGTGHARSRIEALLSLGVANSPMAGARSRRRQLPDGEADRVLDGVDMQWTGEVRRVDVSAIDSGRRRRRRAGFAARILYLGEINLRWKGATQVAVHLSAQADLPDETDGVATDAASW